MVYGAEVNITVTATDGRRWTTLLHLSEEELQAIRHDAVGGFRGTPEDVDIAGTLSGYLGNMLESAVDLFHQDTDTES
jgi:hypothetical protein